MKCYCHTFARGAARGGVGCGASLHPAGRSEVAHRGGRLWCHRAWKARYARDRISSFEAARVAQHRGRPGFDVDLSVHLSQAASPPLRHRRQLALRSELDASLLR